MRINIAEAMDTAPIAATRQRTPDGEDLVSEVAFRDDVGYRKYADSTTTRSRSPHLDIGVFWVVAPDHATLEADWSL